MADLEQVVFETIRAQMCPALGIDSNKDKLDSVSYTHLILTNEVYIGVLAQGKRGTPNYKVRVVKSKDESAWVKVENAHEALVSYEDFMAVKVMMQRICAAHPIRTKHTCFPAFCSAETVSSQ